MRSNHRNYLVCVATAAFAIAPIALCASELTAQDTTVQFDPGQTKVEFTLADVLHTVHGEFRLKQGAIHFDPSTGAASGALVIDATSGNSGSGARDSRMQKNVLESKKYPDITFEPHHVTGHFVAEGESDLQVEGTFTIHGAAHPMTLPAKVISKGGVVNVETHFVVPYVQWGMKDPSNFLLHVSNKVDIDIKATVRLQLSAAS
jgi:polyisoprenoid-binding protein YceI